MYRTETSLIRNMHSLSRISKKNMISSKMNSFVKKSSTNISEKSTSNISPIKNIDIPKIYDRGETPSVAKTPAHEETPSKFTFKSSGPKDNKA